MVLQFRRFVLSSLGFLLLAFFGQPFWAAFHGALAKLPSSRQSLTTASTPVGDVASKSGPANNRSYGTLPIYFEPNLGQTDSQVKFIVRGSGAPTFLTSTGAVFALPIADWRLPVEDTDEERRTNEVNLGLQAFKASFLKRGSRIHNPKAAIDNRQSTITMRLVGSNPNAKVEGLDRLPGITNYFIGNDPERWRTNIPHYAKVLCRDVYLGIDLIYYGNPEQLEYDLVVAPGADPQRLLIAFDGADRLSINDNGDLQVEIGSGYVLQNKPRVYQLIKGRPTRILADYRLTKEKQVAFSLGDHDVTEPIFIDPVLSFSYTFTGQGFSSGIVLDSSGSAYLTGVAFSADFHTNDAFVAKLNTVGSLIYSTFLGGGAIDSPSAIAVDQGGNAYVAGGTNSNDFPTTPGAYQRTYGNGFVSFGPSDAFVTKLNPTGSALVYSTYLGGKDGDGAAGIAIDAPGNAYVTGSTSSTDFPVSIGFPNPPGAFQKIIGGSSDVFVTKLNPTGAALVYSTYLGGQDQEFPAGLRLNNLGEAYVAGTTKSVNFPVTPRAYQTSYLGGSLELGGDLFATRLNASGTGLIYSTYLGSAEADRAAGLALDSLGNLYISGESKAVPNNPEKFVYPEGFVKILNPTGTLQVYSTHLAGGIAHINGLWEAGGIEVDAAGNAYVLDSQSLKKLNASNDSILNTIQFGGFDPKLDITSFAFNPAGEIYVAGQKSTGATIFCGGGITSTFYQHRQAYLGKWTESTTLFVPIVLSATWLNNSFFTSELTLTNTGPKDAKVSFTYVAAFGSGSGSAATALPAGRQQIVPDAIEYLRSLGLPIPATGNRGGTLRIQFSEISSTSDVAAMVRTTTAAGAGRAGLAYPAVPASKGLTDPVYLLGLRQNELDRSNVAVQNAGLPADGDIVLRLTIFSGDRDKPLSLALPDIQLGPGEFRQINGILNSDGASLQNGYIQVERLSGSAPYYAYGVINDQVSSDGSFVPPTSRFLAAGQDALWLPAVVESGQFDTEVIVTNWSGNRKVIGLSFRSQALMNPNKTAFVSVELEAGEQRIIPRFVQYLRANGFGEVGPVGPTYVGTIMGRDGQFRCTNLQGVSISARTSARSVGGTYGVFYSGVPQADTSAFSSVWLYGLQQNSENRTNLALASTAALESSEQGANEFRIELFDGDTGARVSAIDSISLHSEPWKQVGSILAQYAPATQQGYARVSRTKGGSPFIAYAVINDGATPAERTGDGAFIESSP